jgi:hypothetical protein
MIFGLIVLLCALIISGIAAWYSIIGLIAIFAASPLPIALMGASLEAGKLVAASWLYKNWKEAPRFLKYYLTFAVVVLMFITSLGIFGFLSKAHIESNIDVGDTAVQLRILQRQEQITEERIEFLLKKAGEDPEKISRKTADQIQQAQDELIAIQQKKLPLQKQENALMAEVGPLKYIAEAIYGKDAESHFDSAVRFVIILLIFVFDPLAVLLVIAANYTLRKEHLLSLPTPEDFVEKKSSRTMPDSEVLRKKKKIDLTSLDPIPMTKDEVEKKTNLFER